MKMNRKDMLHRRVKIKKSQTAWVSVGAIGVVTDIPAFGGVGVRIPADQVQYPPGHSHPHVRHDFETFHFKTTDVVVLLTEQEQ